MQKFTALFLKTEDNIHSGKKIFAKNFYLKFLPTSNIKENPDTYFSMMMLINIFPVAFQKYSKSS